LKSIKGQVVAYFIIEHSIDQNSNESYNFVSIHPWKLFFDGLARREGEGVGIVLISPRGAIFEQSVRLEYCSMGVKHVEAFGDSLLVVQQITGTFQCLDGSLNAYLDKCLKIIALFNDFTVHHVSRDENTVANDWAQQASCFQANRGIFGLPNRTVRFSASA
jgi:hypothetical protein